MSTSDQHSAAVVGQSSEVPRQGGPDPRAGASAATEPPARSWRRPESTPVRLGRLAGVASWALALVLTGSASAIVGLFHVFGGGPGWFTPVFITTGVVGMLLTMMAFATIRFKGVPFMFMTAATSTLLAAFVMLSLA
ncbi:hypothetical protein GCM10027447_02750 [Glycomyces halotolerans]